MVVGFILNSLTIMNFTAFSMMSSQGEGSNIYQTNLARENMQYYITNSADILKDKDVSSFCSFEDYETVSENIIEKYVDCILAKYLGSHLGTSYMRYCLQNSGKKILLLKHIVNNW